MMFGSDFYNGCVFEYEGAPYKVLYFQHHKPGKGRAFMRVKIKNLKDGAIIERTFRPEEKFQEVQLDRKRFQYLYKQGTDYWFMEVETYEQISVGEETLGEGGKFLKENAEIQLLYWKGQIIGVELPTTVELKVTYTEPGLKGDTVQGAVKAATLENGHTLQVPLFIEVGDVLRVDTRTGEYIQRV